MYNPPLAIARRRCSNSTLNDRLLLCVLMVMIFLLWFCVYVTLLFSKRLPDV